MPAARHPVHHEKDVEDDLVESISEVCSEFRELVGAVGIALDVVAMENFGSIDKSGQVSRVFATTQNVVCRTKKEVDFARLAHRR